MEKLITAKEAAKVIGITAQTMRAWVKEGKIPGTILPDGGIRLSPRTLEMWIQKNTTQERRHAI